MELTSLFQCPVCAKVLVQGEKQYACANGHGFDIASQGYVNLLLPHQRGTGDPGDTKEMIRSRGEFLGKGYYDAFSDRLNEFVISGLSPQDQSNRINILDAGCGEGYYLRRLKDALSSRFPTETVSYYGIDIAKPAIAAAATRERGIRFAVASIHHLPILPECMNAVLCVFAPRDEGEIRRVLTPRGRLIVAAPGPRHLYQFRTLLYDNPEIIGSKGDVGAGFTLVESENVAYEIHLRNTEDILHLLTMTPYGHHADAAALERLRRLSGLVTEVDFNVRVYAKHT